MTSTLTEQIHLALNRKPQTLIGKTALVTGASSGIGLAVAVKLAIEGCHLHIVARRSERLSDLRKELLGLNPNIAVHAHALDLTETKNLEVLQDAGAFDADILINNAGVAKGLAKIVDSKPQDEDDMIRTNLLGAMAISKRAAQQMIQRNHGDIVVLSSIAAHSSYEHGAVYCATKHALRAFHESLRLESLAHGVRVMMISPGMVETEFSLVRFSGDHERAKAVYSGVHPLDAADVASSILFALQQPSHMNIDDMIIKPQQQGNPWKVSRKNQS